MILEAVCTECAKPFFGKRRDAKRCSSECRRRYRIRQVLENRDPVKHCEASARYSAKNRDRKAAYDFARREQVSERRKAQHRARYAANREAFIEAANRRRSGYALAALPKDTASRVFARAGGACVYCGGGGELELEHVLPLSRGGKHSTGNLAAACRVCNRQKSNKTVMEWRVWRRSVGLSDLASLAIL